jgi:hypothetical protein
MSAENTNTSDDERQQTTDKSTVIAEVGVGHNETHEVPQTAGRFEHREIPNNSTTTWERIHQPHEESEYPYVGVKYTISCMDTSREASDDFHISRTVIACSRQRGVPNFPHANQSEVHTEDVVSVRTVAHGFAEVEDALPFAVRLMEADSAAPSLPPELSNRQRESYHNLKSGNND